MIIKTIKTERALSPTSIELADYVINPYTGCQFGCPYCYTKSNKNIKKQPHTWGNFVYIKENLPELLEKELKTNNDIKRILIGSTTDPFQPVETEYRITKKVLNILRQHDIKITILTKSLLIEDYLDMLDYSDQNTVYFTYIPDNIKDISGSHDFNKEKRINLIETIKNSNLDLIVYISPVLPGLIDFKSIFEKLEGKTNKIYIENYNIKLGNWQEVKIILKKENTNLCENILLNRENYITYWDNFKKEIEELNKIYSYKIKFFIYPFNSYY